MTTFAVVTILAGGPAGIWTGTSLCTIKDSPCHDERVVYHITEPDAGGSLKIQADKIIDGKAEDMGTLDCTYAKADMTIVCEMKNGVWKFKVQGKRMDGTLTLSDKRLYRNISVKKEN